MNAPGRTNPPGGRSAWSIFFLCLAVYLFTYSGSLKSNDERALLSGTDSFVKRGVFTTNQLWWDYTHVSMATSRGDMVPNYEPAEMVAAIPWYLWGQTAGAAAQGILFFNAFITAATAALLYLCALELRYRQRTAAAVALLFAFGTLAWPYSRTFFREPLAVLCLVTLFYALLRLRRDPDGLRWPALAGLALGVALTTKTMPTLAAIPSAALLAGIYTWRATRPEGGAGRSLRYALRPLAAAALPLAAILLLWRWYNVTTLTGVVSFARDVVEYTTNPQLSSSTPQRMWNAARGLAISPYKGIFWYAPALLLALPGFFIALRKQRLETLALALIPAATLAGYSRYLFWSGGVGWGSRCMLTTGPFLALLSAPVLEWLLSERTARTGLATAGRLATGLLLLLSVGLQILGVVLDWRTYELQFLLSQAAIYGGVGEAIDTLYLQPAYSPVFGHIRLLLEGGQPLDFGWVQLRPEGGWALLPGALAVATAGLGLGALAWRYFDRPVRRGVLAAALLAAVALPTVLLLFYRQGDSRYDPYGVDRLLRPLIAPMRSTGIDQALLVPDPTLTDYFLNYYDPRLPWYGAYSEPLPEDLLSMLNGRYRRIWLIRDRNADADDREGRRGPERFLTGAAYKLSEQQQDNWARLLLFSAPGAPVESREPQLDLGEMRLERLTIAVEGGAGGSPGAGLDDRLARVRTGDVLQIGCEWIARAAGGQLYGIRTASRGRRSSRGAARSLAGRRPVPHDDARTRPAHRRPAGHTARRATRPLSPDCRLLRRRPARAPAPDRNRRGRSASGRRGGAVTALASRAVDRARGAGGRAHFLLAVALALPALWPLLAPGFFVSDDGLFHVYRTAALADAWQHGVLYPRLFPEFGFGYGQAVLHYYAPLSYAVPALLALLGLSPATAVEAGLALGFILGSTGAYALGSYLGSRMSGIAGAVAYTYLPYHLADAYTRGALPEHLALGLLPWLLLLFAMIIRELDPGPATMLAAVAWAALLLSHNLSALLAIPLLAAFGVVLAWKHRRLGRLAYASIAGLLGLGLSAGFWLPALTELRYVGLALGPSQGFRDHLLPLARLLPGTFPYPYLPRGSQPVEHPIAWSVAALLVVFAIALVARRTAARAGGAGGRATGAFGLAVALLSAFFLSAAALPVWLLLTPLLGQLQYPWRFHIVMGAGVLLAVVALPLYLPRRAALLVPLLLIVLVGEALLGLPARPLAIPAAVAWSPDQMWKEDAAAGQVGATWTGEFLPLTVQEQRWALGRSRAGAVASSPLPGPPGVTLEEVRYDGYRLSVRSPVPMPLRLHQFWLPAWSARIDEKPARTYPAGELGLVTVDVPAGQSRVDVRWGTTVVRVGAVALAVVALAVWLVLAWRDPRLRWFAAALGVLGVVLVANGSGAGRRVDAGAVQRPGGRYGAVARGRYRCRARCRPGGRNALLVCTAGSGRRLQGVRPPARPGWSACRAT